MRMLPKRPLHLIFNIFKRFSILLCEVYFHKTTSHLHNTNVRMHGVGFVKVGQEIKNTSDQDCFFLHYTTQAVCWLSASQSVSEQFLYRKWLQNLFKNTRFN